MFQFPGFASLQRVMTRLAPRRVAPFGHLGLIACVRLPRAFRSLPRPSSPSCAQASSVRLRSLDHITRQAEHAQESASANSSYLSDLLCNLAHLSLSRRECHSQRSFESMRTQESHDLPLSFSFQTAVLRATKSS